MPPVWSLCGPEPPDVLGGVRAHVLLCLRPPGPFVLGHFYSLNYCFFGIWFHSFGAPCRGLIFPLPKLPFNNFPRFLSEKRGVSLHFLLRNHPFRVSPRFRVPMKPSTGGVEAKNRNSKGGFSFGGAIARFFGVGTPKTDCENNCEDDDAS